MEKKARSVSAAVNERSIRRVIRVAFSRED
jgi:hypothetical protein